MAKVFFSYSHQDEALRNQLESHLALLKNQGLIESWHDRRIVAGSDLDEAIFGEMETANVILLLVSSDFLASHYCYSREMKRAMERHDAGEARVIPVILRACDWTGAPFGKLLATPKDGRAVMSWPDRDEAFADVAKQVRRVVEAIHTAAPQANAGQMPLRAASAPSTPLSATLLPRSSNLRLSQEFSEQDRDNFLRDSYEYVAKFFEGSLIAITERNAEVTGHVDRIDSRRFAAVLYKSGKKGAECSVRLEGLGGRDSLGIAFSFDGSARSGSYNEMFHVEATKQSLYLKPLGMAWRGGHEQHLSPEGAAEALWSMFIERLQ